MAHNANIEIQDIEYITKGLLKLFRDFELSKSIQDPETKEIGIKINSHFVTK
jgi:hypothetical protein